MKRHQPNKEGAALVIALGFLAILTVMILAFMVQSRSERLAGRAYLNNAQAKQLLRTALARSLEDIDSTFNTNYPQLLALGSLGNTGLPIAGSIDFSTERDYIPLGNTLIRDAFEAELTAANWENVTVDGTNIGRIAYIAVNTSGLLDANSVGELNGSSTLTERNFGLSPTEIQLSRQLLPELNSTANIVEANGALTQTDKSDFAFIHNRETAWRRFESLRDLQVLNDSKRGGVLSGDIESFSVFSHFPQTGIQGIELSETLTTDQLSETLLLCGFDATEADAIKNGYLDYIDADSIPNDLLSTGVEAVPMVNEIWMESLEFTQNAVDETNVEYVVSGELYVETWYPFNEDQPAITNLDIYASDPFEDAETGTNAGPRGVEVLVGEDNIGASDYITVMAFFTNETAKAFVLELTGIENDYGSNDRFSTYAYEFNFEEDVILELPFKPEEGEDIAFPTRITLTMDAIEVVDQGPVDRAENIMMDLVFDGNGILPDIGAMCVDPRVNYDFSDTEQWMLADAPTPREINNIEDWGEEADLAEKENIRFHVANAPMENAAELGYLSIGTPWRTVRLYGDEEDLNPVLDYFHTGEDFRSAVARPGLINLNSPYAGVLASAFLNAPIQTEIGSSEMDDRISPDQALTLGTNLAAFASGPRNFSPSHVGNALSNNVQNWTEWTDAQKESIVANSYRLFGKRDTLYTILLVAQEGTDLNGNGIEDHEVRSSQQAVVQVWRDPDSEKSAITFFGLSDTLRNSIGIGESWSSILNDFAP